MIISCTMAGTGNGPEVLNRSPGPVTRLQLDRKIKCDVCEALIVPTSYKRHKKTIHNDNSLGKQWKCNQCQKNLQSKSRLAQHEKSHRSTELDQGGNFSCNECKFVTENRNYLRDHKRRMHLIQDGIWLCVKGKCELQPKSFTNSYKLQKHQGIHADVLCEKCEKPFGTKRSLQRHIKAKHQEAHIGENQGDEEVEEVTVSTNIDHLDSVDVGDLVVIPFDPLTEDPLTSEHPNDSLPMELMPNDLDQAFLV